MALSLASLSSSKRDYPPVCVFYSPPGRGKTTLASEFPDPLYLATPGETPPSDVDIPTPGEIENIDDVLDIIGELLTTEHDRKTLIIDSLDGLEPMVWAETCKRNGWKTIEEPGFGKGYVAADEVWREYFGGVQALARAGVAVVQISHTEIFRFDSPTTDPYSRYHLKLHKRAQGFVTESAGVIGFIDARVTLKEKDVGFSKKVGHAEGGGARVIFLDERPGFIAKNRFNMPASIDFKKGEGYRALSKYFPAPTGVAISETNSEAA